MSSTSITFSKHDKRRRRQRHRDEEIRSDESMESRDFYTERSRESQLEYGKWSRNKLKQELSSFIAEFSYMTDTSNKSQVITPISTRKSNTIPAQQRFHAYAVPRELINLPFEDHNDVRRGEVEWEDQLRGAIAYNVQQHPARRGNQRVGRVPTVRVIKSRFARSSIPRDFSTPQKTLSRRRVRKRFSVSRSPANRSRGRVIGYRPVTPTRKRVRTIRRRRSRTPYSCSKSSFKDMPYYVRRGAREMIVKKFKPKVAFKSIEPCAEPNLVTLFPKPNKCSRPRGRCRELELPCKCAICTYKYRSLARLCQDHPYFNYSTTPPWQPCGTCLPCRPKCQVVPRDRSPCSSNWYCNTGGLPCNYPYANHCYREDCCHPLEDRSVKSVSFNFRSFDQCLDSKVTHYFQSILDRRACC